MRSPIRVVRDLFSSLVVARIIPTWKQNTVLPQPRDFGTLMDEGYRKNVVIHGCIRELATSVAEPTVEIVDSEGAPVKGVTPLGVLMLRPNSEQSQYAFFEELVTYLNSAGNNYIHMVRSSMDRVVEIWNLRPDRVKIVPGADGMVKYYEYDVGDGAPTKIDPNNVIHLKYPDPLDDYYGLSPIAVLARWGDIDNQSAEFLRAFFANAGQPQGYLKLKGRVPKEERERLREAWKEQYGGFQGWHTTAVMDADAEYKELGSRPKDLDLGHIFGQSESRICLTFGVPAVVVGVRVGLTYSTYANYQEARRSFWHETLKPMYSRIQQGMNHGLAPEFGTNTLINFNLSKIESLAEDRDIVNKRIVSQWDAGLVTQNEARIALGWPTTPEGDAFKVRPPEIIIPVGQHIGVTTNLLEADLEDDDPDPDPNRANGRGGEENDPKKDKIAVVQALEPRLLTGTK